jgi:sugar/nucleoside kinase (ribokinase family)
MTTPLYDITAIGNAIVDVLAFVPDDFLNTHAMTKGAMQLVDAQAIASLRHTLKESRECSGGSAANTVAALSQLGSRACFMGRVSNDALGAIFTHDIRSVGVAFNPHPAEEGKPTAACIICVTPDGERTMNTYIGSCADFTPDDVDESVIRASRLLYVEGYLWDAPPAKAAIMRAIAVARESGVKVAFLCGASPRGFSATHRTGDRFFLCQCSRGTGTLSRNGTERHCHKTWYVGRHVSDHTERAACTDCVRGRHPSLCPALSE